MNNEKKAFSKQQAIDLGFDYTAYEFNNDIGEFEGELVFKKWGKKANILAYVNLDDGRQILCTAFQNSDYLGLDDIEIGTRIKLVYDKRKKNDNVYLKNVIIIDNDDKPKKKDNYQKVNQYGLTQKQMNTLEKDVKEIMEEELDDNSDYEDITAQYREFIMTVLFDDIILEVLEEYNDGFIQTLKKDPTHKLVDIEDAVFNILEEKINETKHLFS